MGGFILFLIVVALTTVGALYSYTKSKLKSCTADYNTMCEQSVKKFQTEYNASFLASSGSDIKSVDAHLASSVESLSTILREFNNIKTVISEKKNDAGSPLYWNRTINDVPDREDYRLWMQERITEVSQLRVQSSTTIANLEKIPHSYMMNGSTYGVPNQSYLNSARNVTERDVLTYVDATINALNEKSVKKILTIDFDQLTMCMWYYAMKRPYSAQDFTRVTAARTQYYPQCPYEEATIASLYVAKQMSADNVMRDSINKIVKGYSDGYEVIASALMWLKDYDDERVILEAMLTKNIQMTTKLQERLKSLSKGSNAVHIRDIQRQPNQLYFDVSSVSWKPEMYSGLFEDLAFQEKMLTYALAVRDENKELALNSAKQSPDEMSLLKKLKAYLMSEYGSAVEVKREVCVALSDNTQEQISGIVVTTSACNYFALLLCMVPIGKKLNIKFYSLFLPTAKTVSQQQQEAISLLNQINLTATTWENSLKQSVLTAIQQLLNEGSSPSAPTPVPVEPTEEIEF